MIENIKKVWFVIPATALIFLMIGLMIDTSSENKGMIEVNYSTNIITSEQVDQFVKKAGIEFKRKSFPSMIATDENYVLPDKRWVEKKLLPAMKENMFGLKFKDESFDCDDFALQAKVFANKLHRMSKNKPKGAAFPIAVYGYNMENGDNHAINLILVDNEGKPEFLFVEPQKAAQVFLKKNEYTESLLIYF